MLCEGDSLFGDMTGTLIPSPLEPRSPRYCDRINGKLTVASFGLIVGRGFMVA
jgi:hypothetical protein